MNRGAGEKETIYWHGLLAELPVNKRFQKRGNILHTDNVFKELNIILYMGVARIVQRGGHTDSYRGYSSDCHLNIVSCLLTRRLTKGGSRAPQDPPPVPWLRLCYKNQNTDTNVQRFMFDDYHSEITVLTRQSAFSHEHTSLFLTDNTMKQENSVIDYSC